MDKDIFDLDIQINNSKSEYVTPNSLPKTTDSITCSPSGAQTQGCGSGGSGGGGGTGSCPCPI